MTKTNELCIKQNKSKDTSSSFIILLYIAIKTFILKNQTNLKIINKISKTFFTPKEKFRCTEHLQVNNDSIKTLPLTFVYRSYRFVSQ